MPVLVHSLKPEQLAAAELLLELATEELTTDELLTELTTEDELEETTELDTELLVPVEQAPKPDQALVQAQPLPGA